MKVKTVKPCDGPNGEYPIGTEITHPDAYRLCEMGLAEPVDAEAKEMFAKFKEYSATRHKRVLAREAALEEEKKQARLRSFEKRLMSGKL